MEPKVFIVVLNWNGRNETLACLWSLSRIDYGNYGVIVVDNGSTDGSPEDVERLFPDVHLIRNRVNVGFDEGNNIGIRKALELGADAVFLLNNDTVVCKNILRALADAAGSLPRAGVLGPKIYYFDSPELFWWTGCQRKYSKTGWLLNYTQEGKGQKDRGQFDSRERIAAVIGCAMYIRREVFEQAGLLDARFFIYHEEYDFCFRAEHAGWLSYFVPDARVWHKISLSMGGFDSPSLIYLWTRNWLLLSRKQTRIVLWPFLYFAYFRESYWVYQRLRASGKIEASEAALAGTWSSILNCYGRIKDLQPPRLLSRLISWDYRRRVAKEYAR